MPTKEEILKIRTAPFENMQKFNHNHINALKVSVLFGMEEYAKQEALEFNFFYICTKYEYTGWTYEAIWNEYQKSKLKK